MKTKFGVNNVEKPHSANPFSTKKIGANSFFGYEQMAVYSVFNNMLTNWWNNDNESFKKT